MATHPLLDAGKASRDAAEKNVWEQQADFFPVLSANGRAGRIHQNDDTTRASTGDDAYSWMGEGTVSLTQPLFSGFSTINKTLAAKDRLNSADRDIAGIEEELSVRATRAHLNMMRTKELLDLAEKYLQAIQERKDNIALMVSEGAADESEDLQASEILMSAKTTRLGYEESYRQAEADYMAVAGAPPEDTLEFGQPLWDKFVPATVEEAVTRAGSSNPRIQSSDKMIDALVHDTRADTASMLPRFDAEVSYTEKDQDDAVGGELMSAQAMLKMGWNFSTGGAQLARVAKGKEQQAEAAARKKDTLREIEHLVRQKYTSMQVVDQQFGLYTDREQAAEKILNNYLSQFEGGKQSNLQLISAHAKLFEARAARTDAYYRRLLSRFELLSSMGVLKDAFDAEPAEQASLQ